MPCQTYNDIGMNDSNSKHTNFVMNKDAIFTSIKTVIEDKETSTTVNVGYLTDVSARYCILYQPAYSIIPKLTGTTQKVLFQYIFVKLHINQNWLTIRQKDVVTYLGISQPKVSEALKSLIDNRFIAKSNSENNVYIINHNYFFKGNRNKFITDYDKSTF